ncbi:glycosyltransferase family 2 protein [Cryobacterium sp. N21]|uniref:glycosyltransferase family 2 protein n=1 Tax=Cryobacterium sp. N21 TaxID=2048289 RepID=UPI000CE2E79B|nr:glycosyltransferase family 2 protein [Cryobacterium sp. N21]
MKTSIVIPCYRSALVLTGLVERTAATMTALVDQGVVDDWELILVVDGSPDNTAAVAIELVNSQPRVRVLELRRNFGQHNALLAGIRDANFETTVTIDDDLQHPPEEIPKLLAVLTDPGVDLVYAVPEEEEHGAMRSSASRFVKASLALAGVDNAKWVGAFRAFKTDLRDGFASVNDSQLNLDVLLSWSTTAVSPIGVTMNRREQGRSSYSFSKLVSHAMNMVTGYGVVPLKLATWLGFACGVLGIVLLLVVLIHYVLGETTVAGFTTTVALISLFSGAQMITIGIIGEYLGRQHFRSMQKPTYLVRTRHSNTAARAPKVAQMPTKDGTRG